MVPADLVAVFVVGLLLGGFSGLLSTIGKEGG